MLHVAASGVALSVSGFLYYRVTPSVEGLSTKERRSTEYRPEELHCPIVYILYLFVLSLTFSDFRRVPFLEGAMSRCNHRSQPYADVYCRVGHA